MFYVTVQAVGVAIYQQLLFIPAQFMSSHYPAPVGPALQLLDLLFQSPVDPHHPVQASELLELLQTRLSAPLQPLLASLWASRLTAACFSVTLSAFEELRFVLELLGPVTLWLGATATLCLLVKPVHLQRQQDRNLNKAIPQLRRAAARQRGILTRVNHIYLYVFTFPIMLISTCMCTVLLCNG